MAAKHEWEDVDPDDVQEGDVVRYSDLQRTKQGGIRNVNRTQFAHHLNKLGSGSIIMSGPGAKYNSHYGEHMPSTIKNKHKVMLPGKTVQRLRRAE